MVGGPIDHDQLPAEMLIDYVRVYQFNNLFGAGVEVEIISVKIFLIILINGLFRRLYG